MPLCLYQSNICECIPRMTLQGLDSWRGTKPWGVFLGLPRGLLPLEEAVSWFSLVDEASTLSHPFFPKMCTLKHKSPLYLKSNHSLSPKEWSRKNCCQPSFKYMPSSVLHSLTCHFSPEGPLRIAWSGNSIGKCFTNFGGIRCKLWKKWRKIKFMLLWNE